VTAFSQATATALAVVPRAYPLNKVPASPTMPYVVYSATFSAPETYTNDAAHSVRIYRITWQTFGRDIDGVSDVDSKVVDALLDKRLTVTGWDCGPCGTQHGGILGVPVRDPDDRGVVGTTSSLTFAATKE